MRAQLCCFRLLGWWHFASSSFPISAVKYIVFYWPANDTKSYFFSLLRRGCLRWGIQELSIWNDKIRPKSQLIWPITDTKIQGLSIWNDKIRPKSQLIWPTNNTKLYFFSLLRRGCLRWRIQLNLFIWRTVFVCTGRGLRTLFSIFKLNHWIFVNLVRRFFHQKNGILFLFYKFLFYKFIFYKVFILWLHFLRIG